MYKAQVCNWVNVFFTGLCLSTGGGRGLGISGPRSLLWGVGISGPTSLLGVG